MTQALPAARDLIQPPGDPWEGLPVPEGWEPIARACRRVYDDLAAVAKRVADLVQEEIPAYRESGVRRQDLEVSAFRNGEMLLIGLAQRRGPLQEELDVRRELGRRRALEGLPADSLLQAYHVGYRVLWHALVEAAGDDDPGTLSLLLSAATLMWEWVQAFTNTVADAHHETTRGQELRTAALRQRFFDLLVSGEIDSDEFVELAHTAGFDTDGEFTALCVDVGSGAHNRDALGRMLGDVEGLLMSFRRHDAILLLQGQDAEMVVHAIRKTFPAVSIGVGMKRRGSMGARLSVGDAERVLALAEAGETKKFEQDWMEASLVPGLSRLSDILAPGQEIGASNPELANTVVAFAECDFSLAETARRLSVHPNTVTYRLDRWETLTGWDPRTFSGLTRSIASVRIGR
jgi:hypothetical protein